MHPPPLTVYTTLLAVYVHSPVASAVYRYVVTPTVAQMFSNGISHLSARSSMGMSVFVHDHPKAPDSNLFVHEINTWPSSPPKGMSVLHVCNIFVPFR